MLSNLFITAGLLFILCCLTPFRVWIYELEKHVNAQVHTYFVGPHGLVADLSVNRTFDNSGNQFGNVLFLLFLTRSLLHCKERSG